MKPEFEKPLKAHFVELVVYAGLVAVYYFAVLHFLGGWLEQLFVSHRDWYAGVALALIIGQGLVLDKITRVLLRWIQPRVEG